MRVMMSELRRFCSRRAIAMLLLLGVVVTVAITGIAAYQQRPVDQAEIARAERIAEREARQPYVQRRLDRCVERTGSADACEHVLPKAEWFMTRSVLSAPEAVHDLMPAIAGLLGLIALIAGTSFVGAEYASGSLSNLLLFEPRRWRVWSAKLVATTAIVTTYAAVLLGAAFVTLAQLGHAWQDSSWTGQQWWHWTYFTIRCVLIVAAAGAFGVGVTLMLRSTVATVGAVLAYMLVGEAMLRAVLGFRAESWLASNYVAGFVLGRHRLTSWEGSVEVLRFHLSEAALTIGVVMTLLLFGSALVFRRRDLV